MNVFDLYAKLTLDDSEYNKGLDESEKKASGFGDKLKTAMKVGLGAIAAVGTATAAMTGAMVKGTAEVAAYGDNIDKMSQKMGLSAEAYQEWDAVMRHSGTSMESMQASMKTLANAVETGNEAFQKLGISQEELANMDQEQIFEATISALQNVEDTTERTYLAGKLLGRGATELGALLNTSAEDTEAMRQKVHELGGVMSDDAVKASAKYQDTLQDMTTAFSGLKRGMMSEFLPSITQVMEGLTALFSGGDGLGQISEGINSFVENLSANMPKVLETGTGIVLALTEAIVANLPTLLQAGVDAIMTLADGLIQNLPAIIEAGLQILVSLANGIAENLPTLIPTIVDVVLQIVDTLTQPDTLSNLIDAAIAIIIALANGLIDALPQLLQKAPEIISNLMTAIIENAPKLLKSAFELIKTLAQGIVQNLPLILQKGVEIVKKVISGVGEAISGLWDAGMDIVKGIWQGISNGFGWIKERISGWVGDLLGFFKRILKIGSPSKVFADSVGKFMAQGIGLGFVDEMPKVEKMLQNAMPEVSGLLGATDFTVKSGRSAPYTEIVGLLQEILASMGYDIVLDDGTLVGRMDKLLGRRTLQRARGNA